MEKKTTKGRPITCKLCSHKYQIDKQQREDWKINKYRCPKCNSTYSCIPPTEKYLRELQDQYYENGKRKEDMLLIYNECANYTRSLILRYFQKAITSPDILEYHVRNTVSFLMEDYYKKDQLFQINISFGGYLKIKIRQSLYSKNEIFNESSIDMLLDFGKDKPVEFQIEDKASQNRLREIEDSDNEISLLDSLDKKILNKKSNRQDYIKELIYLKLFLEKKQYNVFKKKYKVNTNITEDLKQFLYDFHK